MADKENKALKAEAKSKKPEKKKGKVGEAWRGFKSETNKIVWPTWKQVLKNSCIVLGIVIVCALMIVLLDYVFEGGIKALANIFVKGA